MKKKILAGFMAVVLCIMSMGVVSVSAAKKVVDIYVGDAYDVTWKGSDAVSVYNVNGIGGRDGVIRADGLSDNNLNTVGVKFPDGFAFQSGDVLTYSVDVYAESKINPNIWLRDHTDLQTYAIFYYQVPANTWKTITRTETFGEIGSNSGKFGTWGDWDTAGNYALYIRPQQIATVYFDNLRVTVTREGYQVPVTSISLSDYFREMRVGESFKNKAYVYPNKATNKRLAWSSNNPLVATVNDNGLVTAKSAGTATITAKSNNGKSTSCVVEVTDSTILNYSDYKYSFGNDRSSFGYNKNYKIPYERYMQLGYEKSEAKTFVEKWDGSCFGMSTSSILFYKNIMQEERYNESVHVPSQFASPNAGNGAFLSDKWEVKLRHMIELMQISLKLNYPAWSREQIGTIVDVIKSEIDKGNPILLALDGYNKEDKNKTGGHAVVIYGYDYADIGMRLYIYDCSGFVDSALYQEGSTNFAFHYLKDDWVWDLDAITSYEYILEKYNYLHSLNDNATALFSLTNNSTYTYVICPAENMTITNSLGKVSTITDGEVSGDIQDIKLIPSSYLAEEPSYAIILPTDTYTIVGSGDEVIETSFADDYMSASITAKASTPITISSDLKEITVDSAEGEEYGIRYTVWDNIFDEMTLSGVATGTVTTKLTDADVSVSGIDTLTATASVSESMVTADAEGLAGSGEITVKCEEAENGATIQILSAETELTEKTALPERLTVEAPVYDLESGEYTEGQLLSFTKDDETIVYYTTDGSTPSADNGIIYSLPIEVNKSMQIKAVSTKFGYGDSDVVELNYTLPEVNVPTASVESGEYDDIITVSLSSGDYNDDIYYTLDGSNPLEGGMLYTVPVNISKDTKLQAYTLRNGCISEIGEYNYTIAPKNPFYFSNSLTNQDGEVLMLDNISELTKVNVTLSKLQEGEHTSEIMIAFYDENDHLIYATHKSATISDDMSHVEIDIEEDVSSAYKVKVFAWDGLSSMRAMCKAWEEIIAE